MGTILIPEKVSLLPTDAAHNRKHVGSTILDTKLRTIISKTLISDYDYWLVSTADILSRLAKNLQTEV